MADDRVGPFRVGEALVRLSGVGRLWPPAEIPPGLRALLTTPLPPRYVVHTVHGTWGKRSAWPGPSSELSRDIVSKLPGPARIEPLTWSGRNQVGARERAAHKLRVHLRKKFQEFPDARHFVVAHSHGGNVALMAAAEPDIANGLSGVATLSTPFLSSEVREVRTLDASTAFIAALCTGLGYAAWRLFRGATWSDIGGPTTLAIVAAWVAIAAGGLLFRAMHRQAVRIDKAMPRTRLTPEQVAILRVQGDEPIAAIAGLRLAGTISDALYGAVDRPLSAASSWLLQLWNYQALGHVLGRLVEWVAPPSVAVPGATSMPNPLIDVVRTHWPLGVALMLQTFFGASPLVHSLVLAVALLYALPAAFAVLVEAIRIPFALVSGLSLASIGLIAPFAGPYLNLAAEASPPGRWTVTNLSGGGIYGGLLHSKIYAQQELVAVITGWIVERLRAEGEAAGVSPAGRGAAARPNEP